MPTNNNAILSSLTETVRDIDFPNSKRGLGKYRTVNYVKGKDAEIKNDAFSYVNSKGDGSFRDVDIKISDGEYVEGYCHLSRKFRAFRLNRIQGGIIV